ncbi:MAG: HAD hydrolase-like protein [Solirubrobacteraceae bacterium]
MVGDRKHDITAAHEHNIPAIGVLWGIGSEQELLAAGANALAQTPTELATLARSVTVKRDVEGQLRVVCESEPEPSNGLSQLVRCWHVIERRRGFCSRGKRSRAGYGLAASVWSLTRCAVPGERHRGRRSGRGSPGRPRLRRVSASAGVQQLAARTRRWAGSRSKDAGSKPTASFRSA